MQAARTPQMIDAIPAPRPGATRQAPAGTCTHAVAVVQPMLQPTQNQPAPRRAHRARAVAQPAALAAREATESVQRKFEGGAADLQRLTPALTALTQARAELAQCWAQWQAARPRLQLQAGTGPAQGPVGRGLP